MKGKTLTLLLVLALVLVIAHRGVALSLGVLLRGRLWEQRKRILLVSVPMPSMSPSSSSSSNLQSKYPSILGINSCRDSNMMMLELDENGDEDNDYDNEDSQTMQGLCYNPPSISSLMGQYSTRSYGSYFWYFLVDVFLPIVLGALSFVAARILHLDDHWSNLVSSEKAINLRFKSPEEYDKYLEDILLNADSMNALFEYDQARELIKEAISASYVTKFSKQHDPGTLFHLLSTIESSAGDHVAALNAINNAYEIYENSLGPSIETAYLLEDLSTILTTVGRFDEAKAALRKSKLYLENSNKMTECTKEAEDSLHNDLVQYKQMLMMRAKSDKFSDDEGECSDQDSELEIINNPDFIPPIVHNATQKRNFARLMNQLGGIEYMSGDFSVAIDSYAKSKEMFIEARSSLATIQAVDQNLKASRATSILSAPEFIAFCKNPEDYADESKVLTSSPSSTVSTSAAASGSSVTVTENENKTHQFNILNDTGSLNTMTDHTKAIVSVGSIESEGKDKGKRISPVGIADADIY